MSNGSGSTKTIWSSGGGTQSTAIAVMILTGKLPKPDLAIIADTGYELSSTWEYMERYTVPALDQIGLKLHRVASKDYATVGLHSAKGKLLVPAYTRDNADGSVGKLPTYCSSEWKGRVVQRFAREHFPKTKLFEMWLGMTIDEPNRIKITTGKWINKYPLAEAKLFRFDAVNLVREYGWPTPPKSTCHICPNKSEAHWKDIKENYPQDLKAAKEVEKLIQQKDPDVFLHKQGVNLDEVDFNDAQQDMFTGQCDTGHCFV